MDKRGKDVNKEKATQTIRIQTRTIMTEFSAKDVAYCHNCRLAILHRYMRPVDMDAHENPNQACPKLQDPATIFGETLTASRNQYD